MADPVPMIGRGVVLVAAVVAVAAGCTAGEEEREAGAKERGAVARGVGAEEREGVAQEVGAEEQEAVAQEVGAEEQEAMPTEWETLYVAFLEPGDPGALEDSARQRIMDGHVQHQLRLQRRGDAVAAGGLGAAEGSAVVGLTLLRAPSADSARALIDADPAVAAGVFRATVREWWVPAGRMPPPAD